MKIALIIAWTFEQLDGSSLRFYFTLQELLKRKHDVTVLHASPEAAAFTRSRFGCRSFHVNLSISRWDSIPIKILKYILFVVRGRRLLKTMRFDAVYSLSLLNNLVAIGLAPARSTILYVDFMSNYYRYRNPGILGIPLYSFGNYLERHTMKQADHIIVITNALKQLIPSEYHRKITIIPDGVDTEHFKPGLDAAKIKSTCGIPPDAPVIGYQGGIEPHDGLQFLAHASPQIIRSFPQARFVIAGRGSYLNKVKSLITDLNVAPNWIFLGWVSNDLIPELISATDVNIVPVPNDPCTAPLITFRLLESLGAGVCIVANDLPGMREIANDEMVLFTNVEDPSRFASDVICALSLSPEEKATRSSRCRAKAEQLDWRSTAKQETDFLESHENH